MNSEPCRTGSSFGVGGADRASVSRVLLAYTGDSHTFAVDRSVSAAVAETWPGAVAAARAHRGFLRRAASLAATDGVKQLVDVGAGIAHDQDVPHLMRSLVPDARMAITDIDPVAVAHHRYVWGFDTDVAVAEADATDPDRLLLMVEGSPVNLDEPILVVFGLLLHFLTDDQARTIVSAFRQRVAPGSLLAVSHATDDPTAPAEARAAVAGVLRRHYGEAIGLPVTQRSTSWLRDLLGSFVLYHPGIVDVSVWARSAEADQLARAQGSDAISGDSPEPTSSFVLGGIGLMPYPPIEPPLDK